MVSIQIYHNYIITAFLGILSQTKLLIKFVIRYSSFSLNYLTDFALPKSLNIIFLNKIFENKKKKKPPIFYNFNETTLFKLKRPTKPRNNKKVKNFHLQEV